MVVDIVDNFDNNFQKIFTVPSLFGIPPTLDPAGRDILEVFDEAEDTKLQQVLGKAGKSEEGSGQGGSTVAMINEEVERMMKGDIVNVTTVSDKTIMEATKLEWMRIGEEQRYILMCKPEYKSAFVSVHRKAIPARTKKQLDIHFHPLIYSWNSGFRCDPIQMHPSLREPLIGADLPSSSFSTSSSSSSSSSSSNTQTERKYDTNEPKTLIEYTASFQYLNKKTTINKPGVPGMIWKRNKATPSVVSVGHDFESVRKAAEHFVSHYFPFEATQLLPKNADWKKASASKSQISFLASVRLIPHSIDGTPLISELSKGDASFLFTKRQIRKSTGTIVRKLSEVQNPPTLPADLDTVPPINPADIDDIVTDDLYETAKPAKKRGSDLDDADYFEEETYYQQVEENGAVHEEGQKSVKTKAKPVYTAEEMADLSQSDFEWLLWGNKGYVLPVSVKTYSYIEVVENMLGMFEAWYVKGKQRVRIPHDCEESQSINNVLSQSSDFDDDSNSSSSDDSSSSSSSHNISDADLQKYGSVQFHEAHKLDEITSSKPPSSSSSSSSAQEIKSFRAVNLDPKDPEFEVKRVFVAAEKVASVLFPSVAKATRQRDATWKQHPATDRQVALLKRLGVSFSPNLSKGQAAQLIQQSINKQPA